MMRKCIGCKKKISCIRYDIAETELMFGHWRCKECQLSMINLVHNRDIPGFDKWRFYSKTLIIPTYSVSALLEKGSGRAGRGGHALIKKSDLLKFFGAWNHRIDCL